MVRAILIAAMLPFPLWAVDFTVGSATARSGQKATRHIAICAGVDAAGEAILLGDEEVPF
jgi:hypothetical protein